MSQSEFGSQKLGVCQESVRSLSGVCQESFKSLSGASQESVRGMMVTKFGELIWTALQIETLESIVGFNASLSEVRSQSGVSQEAVRS